MDRLERRLPFAVAVVFLVVGLALRYDILGLHLGARCVVHDAGVLVLRDRLGGGESLDGTAAHRGDRSRLSSACTGISTARCAKQWCMAGLRLLIWLPTIRCPSALTVVAGVLAEASLYTYLVHYQVYALFDGHPALGVLASMAVGVLLTYVVTMLRRWLAGRSFSPKLTFGRKSTSGHVTKTSISTHVSRHRSAMRPSCASVAAIMPS